MRSRFDDDGSGPNIAEVVAEVSDALRGNVRRFGPLLFAVLAVAVVVTGVYSVGPGEQGVVRRFGREHRTAAPGLHYAIPLVEAVNVVNIEEVRRVEVGFNGETTINEEALMLTGDENIVEVQMVVQYRVAEPTKYLFRLREPEASLRVAAEVALRSVVGRTSIDDVMTTGRSIVRAIEPTGGHIRYLGGGQAMDVATLPKGKLKPLRKDIRMVFQDPFSSLNPRMTVMQTVAASGR